MYQCFETLDVYLELYNFLFQDLHMAPSLVKAILTRGGRMSKAAMAQRDARADQHSTSTGLKDLCSPLDLSAHRRYAGLHECSRSSYEKESWL
jgi:hypothetical protein